MAEYYTAPPQSRDEAIVVATINGVEYTAEPESRIEDLLIQLKEAIEEGGGGGGFTPTVDQLAAINSGIDSTKVEQISTNTQNIGAKYTRPDTGIPKTDLAETVQTSLGLADSALQSETDPTVPSWAKQSSKPSYNSDEISDTNRTHKFATQTQLNQISTNQTNISSVEDMVCDNEFDTATAYAVGDYVTHENGLYEFTSAHSAGAWNSNEVTEISLIDVLGNINTVLEAVL